MTDLFTAEALARDGMRRALDHADEREVSQWQDVALMWIHRYGKTHQTFVAEDCIAAAVEWGIACPVPKAFGPVFVRAAKAGIITRIGFAPSKRRHLSPTALWRSNVYRGAA